MNYARLKETKKFIETLTENLSALQEKGWVDLPDDVDFKEVLELDVCNYIMYIIASDSTINVDEVEMYRYLTGFGGDDMDSIKSNIENSDVMSYDFQSKPPISLVLLVKASNSILRCNDNADSLISNLFELYILVYMMVGKEIMQADDRVSYDEKKDYETYIETIKGYIKRHSYVSMDGSLAELMSSLSDYLD